MAFTVRETSQASFSAGEAVNKYLLRRDSALQRLSSRVWLLLLS